MGSIRFEIADAGDTATDRLRKPLAFHFSGKSARTRLMKAAMAEGLATWDPSNLEKRGIPTQELIELYRRWGQDPNWGLIMTGVISISYDVQHSTGEMIVDAKSPFSGERFEKFKEFAAAAKANGSLIVGQVGHPGRQAPESLAPAGEVIAPSPIPLEPKFGRAFAQPRAATHAEISSVVASFAHTAAFLERAGFDGIQIHAAHGNLIAQFLAPSTNKRTDKYGGSLEGRMQVLKEVGLAVRAATGPSFIVGVKLNSVEFQDGGFTPEDAAKICAVLEAEVGFDFVELSGGTFERMGFSWAKESTKRREAFFLEFAERIVPALGSERKTKVYLTGGLRTIDSMNRALRVVDGLGIGCPAAQEPSFASKILNGEIKGAVKPVAPFEDDTSSKGAPLVAAQMAQISVGQQPFDMSNQEAVDGFMQDMRTWELVKENDHKNELVGPVRVSESTSRYTVC